MKKSIFLLVFIFLLLPTSAFAEIIRSFDTQIIANKDGTMNITEAIIYDFEAEDRHGIFRYIPLYSKVGNLYRIVKIHDISIERDGQKEKFEESKNSEQISFKIGDPDRTITGPHTYKISYVVENGIGSNFPDFDEIYWNTTGNDWPVVIEKASAEVLSSFDAESKESKCFTGFSGESQNNCIGMDGKYVATLPLNPGQGMTIVEIYPKSTFPPSVLSRDPPMSLGEKILNLFLKNILLIYFLLNIILPALLIYWYQKKKNKKRFGSPTVNFDIPEDKSGKKIIPAEAGTIDTSVLERDDVVATIFDLAIHKYIKLEEFKKERALAKDKKDQRIIKLKDADSKLNDFEKTLMARLFTTGNTVEVSGIKRSFYQTFQDLEKEMFEDLVAKGFYVKNPKNQRGGLLVLAIFALFTLNIFLALVLFSLSRKLNGRTQLGDELDHKIDGLKLFLKSSNRNFKWQAEKFYTVEHMIPYAMSLGYIDKFMEQVKAIKPDYNPSWCSGYSGNFFSSYSGFYSGMASSVTTSAPSSSSGSSGGSSGGGGGGGGGGSW